jgi:hypothetical protein
MDDYSDVEDEDLDGPGVRSQYIFGLLGSPRLLLARRQALP